MELQKIEGNGVELEVKFKVQWRWSEIEENIYGGGVETDYRNLDILIAMNFRNTISLEIPFELLINSFEHY